MSSLLLLKSMLFAKAMHKSKKKKKVKLKKASSNAKTLDLSMCRTCNEEKGDIPIFDNFVHPNIPEEIQNFSGITINKSDKLPQQMCQSCLDLLNGCIMFREMCQHTNKVMIELSIKKESTNFENNHHISPDHYQDGIPSDEDYTPPSPGPDLTDYQAEGKCEICNNKFNDLKEYKNHLKDCSKPPRKTEPKEEKVPNCKKKQSFLCDTCGKTARSKASLLVHMSTHENIFPFKCDQCPYQGRTMDLLKVHKRSHMADKPFKCTQCPKATTTSSNLAKHMRHVHSTTRPFKCCYCGKGFSYQHDKKRHEKDIHLRTSTVECDVCFKKFNTKKILQGHRWKIHKIKGERQGRLPSYLQVLNQGPETADDNEDADFPPEQSDHSQTQLNNLNY